MSGDTMKVFELAKELGTDSISLLDKLKSVGIQVKNHMSSLSTEQVEKARNELAEKKASGKKTARKNPYGKNPPVPRNPR